MAGHAHAIGAGAAGPAHYAEITVPGVVVGLVAGLLAGGASALAGLPFAFTAAIGAGLGVPLAVLGAGYCVLVATNRFGVGAIGPAAVYWLVGFPLARLVDEFVVARVIGQESVLGEPLWSFLLFQAMLSIGFAIGFLWLHERMAPRWLLRIQEHNPVAAGMVERYRRLSAGADGSPGGERRSR